MEADAEVPPPVAVMTTLELPGVAVAEADRVRVVLQVTVQLVEENEAVTPVGKADVVKDTAVALPETSLAVMISAADAPCPTDRLGEAADTEMVVGGGGTEAVVRCNPRSWQDSLRNPETPRGSGRACLRSGWRERPNAK